MAKRYYLSKIIGTGTMDDPFRVAVADYGVNHVAEYPPQDMNTGKYTKTEAFALADAPSHVELLKDANMFGMPDFPLDGKLSSMRSATLNALNNAVLARGYAVTWGSSDAYRDVVRSLGKQLNTNFDENAFDVSA